MGWMILTTIASIVLAGVMIWKTYRMRRDIDQFSAWIEKSLETMISGEEIEEMETVEDTLTGKVCEKLKRTEHIWRQNEQENIRQKIRLKELISDISHQTRTPIANQKLYLEIMRSKTDRKDLLEIADRLEHQTDKLDFLFQSMVKLSRLENGIIQIEQKRQNLFHTLERAVSAVAPQAAKKGIEISVDAPEILMIRHDSKWTEEAIYNLLDNGVKYTNKGGEIHIRVLTREIFTEIHVEDTGKGIAIERQAQIFRRFYREPEVHDMEGIGIGLYLARMIVEMQKGFIEVCSEEGKGSDFIIYLPV